ncbi:MAG: hypothetical protein JXA98_08060 [Methanosarcinaceae archaeon]|nr:hypothetical protein [Methanosarcinaceae archaeon]
MVIEIKGMIHHTSERVTTSNENTSMDPGLDSRKKEAVFKNSQMMMQ